MYHRFDGLRVCERLRPVSLVGTNDAGSTIEEIENGKPVTYATGANGPAAMAFSPNGPLWIANFGQSGTDGNTCR